MPDDSLSNGWDAGRPDLLTQDFSSHAARIMRTVSIVRGDKGGGTPVSPVTRSWQRCVFDFGIKPHTRRQTQVLTRTELRERQQRWGALLNVALRELENLYELIAGTGYVAALADADGTVLSTLTDPSLRDTFRNSGLCPGAVWDERNEGTNGIGTCLAERTAIVVHHEDHFRDYNTCLSCSGAPIVDIDGRVIGALDASSVNRDSTSALERHTMALVSMSARIISRWQFLTQCPGHWVLRFHSRPEFVGLLQEALLAIDTDGRIVAANDSAVLQLGNKREELVGQMIDTLFAFDVKSLHERASVDPSSIWPVRGVSRGRRFFALVRPPAHIKAGGGSTRSGAHIAAASPEDGGCAISADAKMRRNLACGRQLFARQVPILLHGETGTGKDVFAHALHDHSPWADKPFVVVNCAAIPENLIESELFGYRAGAFTGAAKQGRSGRLLQSSGGTLFLDEIGDMPLLLQARLLRAIEAREIIPVGSDQPVAVDLHLISATHHDLREMVAARQFREDLYYRLAGMTLELPPLRKRQDKADLIHAILAEEANGARIRITPPALDTLLAYPWPGNIRQLRNTLRTAAALCRDGLIKVPNLPQEVVEGALRETPSTACVGDDPLRDAERSALVRALGEHGGNVSRTARALGLSRNTLYRKLRKHAIQHRAPSL